MKKASFITVHIGFNFGSVLQTIATYKILKDLGLDPICVNYIPDRVTHRRYWKESYQGVAKFIKRLVWFPIRYLTELKYNSYLHKYCRLTKPIYKKDDFAELCPRADYYITGSDQVWNSIHNEGIDGHYFFEGILGNKVAFASSIGRTTLDENEMAYFKSQLKQYVYITVRESSAVSLLDSMGIKANLILDPTLLLDKEQWFHYSSKRLVKEPYVFVYLPYNVVDRKTVYETAKKIANTKKLKVISYSNDLFEDKYADKTIKYADPGDLLSLFFYADYVINNSFHGTAFSINLNKEFWTYLPSKFTTRIENILNMCNLEKRVIDTVVSSEQLSEKIDYSKVNKILDEKRDVSIKTIRKAFI